MENINLSEHDLECLMAAIIMAGSIGGNPSDPYHHLNAQEAVSRARIIRERVAHVAERDEGAHRASEAAEQARALQTGQNE